MRPDGKLDYRVYTLEELRDALSGIDGVNYPINLKNLKAEIAARQNPSPASDGVAPPRAQEGTDEPSPASVPISLPPWYVGIPMACIYLLALFTAMTSSTCESDGCIAAAMAAFVTIGVTAVQLFIVLPVFAYVRARRGQEVSITLLRLAGASVLPAVLVLIFVLLI